VLGPVEIVPGNGIPSPGLRRRERTLLAVLLLELDNHVPTEMLIELLWGDQPPTQARRALHIHVARIRSALNAAGAAGQSAGIETRNGSYRLSANPDTIDVHRFRAMVRDANAISDPGRRSDVLRTALDLYRGPLMQDAADDSLRTRLSPDLDGLRLAATETWLATELSLGRHHDVVGELANLAVEHPFRESVIQNLMLALYRCGRRADALAAFARLRERLVDELGVDPGTPVQDLHERILRADPALDLPGAPPPADQPKPANRNFLPYDVPDFTGRDCEVAHLTRLVDQSNGSTVLISAMDGMGGVGKTTLAVHTAHRLTERYPDGQLFVNLRAHTAGQQPLDAMTALAALLRAVGTPQDQIPDSLDERSGRWRSEVSGRRMLILLDNAATVAQVRPLLPGSPGCLTIITSRRRLTGLDGASSLPVDVLPLAEAVRLFARVCGESRVEDDPDLLGEVVEMCGRLPLAIRIAASRLRNRPNWTLRYLRTRLADERRRITELAVDDLSVAATFAMSYGHLSPAHQRLFRLVGLHPGTPMDAYAAAALSDLPYDDAERMLEDLVDVHLLEVPAPGRYQFHDLIRCQARDTATKEESAEAVTRLLDFYLYTAAAAIRYLDAYRREIALDITNVPRELPHVNEFADAVAWLEDHRPALKAAVRLASADGWDRHAWQLARTLRPYFELRGYTEDWLRTHESALPAVRRLGDRKGEGITLGNLGVACAQLGRFADALGHHREGLRLATETGDVFGLAVAFSNLGSTHLAVGEFAESERCFQLALANATSAGNRHGEAIILRNLGDLRERTDRYREALDYHSRSIEVMLSIGERCGEGRSRRKLGFIHYRLGFVTEALDQQNQAYAIAKEVGDQHAEAHALANLGLLRQHQGDHEQAMASYRTALASVIRTQDRVGEMVILSRLGHAHAQAGEFDAALTALDAALTIARATSSRPAEAEILNNLGDAHYTAGRFTNACDHYTQVLELSDKYHLRLERARAHHGLSQVLRAIGHCERAEREARAAVAIYTEIGVPH